MVDRPARLLPANSVLLHIGPYKTGTTAIQSALFAAKPRLKKYGVAYPGRWRRLVGAGYSVLRWAPPGVAVPAPSVWQHFAEAVRNRGDQRVCVSTEDFGALRDESTIRKIVDDLGSDRVQVIAVARGLHRVLPSHWQERVKSGDPSSYADWLGEVLAEQQQTHAYRTFWASHDLAATARAWRQVVGADRFRIVVADDSDRGYLLRVFEQLLGLPAGLLEPDLVGNESLSATRLEAVRRLNESVRDRGWPDDVHRQLIKFGLVRGMQQAPPVDVDHPVRPLPGWARDRVRALAEQQIAAFDELGVEVIGDTDRLRYPEDEPDEDDQPAAGELVSTETLVQGALELTAAALRREEKRASDATDAALLEQLPTKALLVELSGRIAHRIQAVTGALRRGPHDQDLPPDDDDQEPDSRDLGL